MMCEQWGGGRSIRINREIIAVIVKENKKGRLAILRCDQSPNAAS